MNLIEKIDSTYDEINKISSSITELSRILHEKRIELKEIYTELSPYDDSLLTIINLYDFDGDFRAENSMLDTEIIIEDYTDHRIDINNGEIELTLAVDLTNLGKVNKILNMYGFKIIKGGKIKW